MGGTKRLTISRLEKRLKRTSEREKPRKKGPSKPTKIVGDVIAPKVDKELVSQIAKMKAVTPSEVASAFGIRISVAKDLLEDLEKKGIIKLFSGNSRLRIYTINPSARLPQP